MVGGDTGGGGVGEGMGGGGGGCDEGGGGDGGGGDVIFLPVSSPSSSPLSKKDYFICFILFDTETSLLSCNCGGDVTV